MRRLILFAFFIVLKYEITTAEDVSDAFQASQLVPDILDTPPKEILRVNFGSDEVRLGNELTPDQVKTQPSVDWNPNSKKFYLIAMIDPDAPNRQEHTSREFNHWLVGNIPGGDIGSGDVLVEYMGSAPPAGTGLHRYALLIYKQPQKLSFDQSGIKGRAKFSIRSFSNKYNLGDPIAGNFFQAKHD